MLGSRSARLAALFLVILLFGWGVRLLRKGETHVMRPAPRDAAPNTASFPEE